MLLFFFLVEEADVSRIVSLLMDEADEAEVVILL
jgi:hypothetical protein